MTSGRQKIDLEQMKKYLKAGLTNRQMAELFGVSRSAITGAKTRLMKAGETPDTRPQAQRRGFHKGRAMREAQAEEAEEAMPPDLPGPWTTEQDVAIFRTEGRYADLSALAEKWGKPSASVTLRWHRLRSGQ